MIGVLTEHRRVGLRALVAIIESVSRATRQVRPMSATAPRVLQCNHTQSLREGLEIACRILTWVNVAFFHAAATTALPVADPSTHNGSRLRPSRGTSETPSS